MLSVATIDFQNWFVQFMNKILFITAPYHAGVVEVAGRWVPLYMVTVAGACQRAGFECVIYDAMTKEASHDDVRKMIEDVKPDVVAVSTITSTSIDAIKVLATAKHVNPQIVTIAGGIHASFMYDEILRQNSCVDYIVVGEGEITLVELLRFLQHESDPAQVSGVAFNNQQGSVTVTSARPHMKSLDALPMAWDLLDWDDYTYHILPGSRLGAIATSRGCEFGCTFCSQQKFWKKSWRGRSPEDVVREIQHLHDIYHVDVVLLTDDYPTPDRVRWERILDQLIALHLPVKLLMETRAQDIIRDKGILHKYKDAGIIHIYVGTEATCQQLLDLVQKEQSVDESIEALRLCRQHGIITETSMILGFPDDTKQSIGKTIARAKELNPDFAHFLAIAPWPYADIYKELEPYIEERDYRRYNLVDPVIKPTLMTRQEVDEAIVDGYRQFYMGRFNEILAIEDEFIRRYMLTAVKRMMEHSFIREKIGRLDHGMPKEMQKILADISHSSPEKAQYTPSSK